MKTPGLNETKYSNHLPSGHFNNKMEANYKSNFDRSGGIGNTTWHMNMQHDACCHSVSADYSCPYHFRATETRQAHSSLCLAIFALHIALKSQRVGNKAARLKQGCARQRLTPAGGWRMIHLGLLWAVTVFFCVLLSDTDRRTPSPPPRLCV